MTRTMAPKDGPTELKFSSAPEFLDQIAAHFADDEKDIAPERKPYEVPDRAPAQAGGPLDPGMDKTHEIKDVVRDFVNGPTDACDRPETRSRYVTDWLDLQGITAISQMGSIRDQAALYDHIDRYVEA